MEEGGLRFMMNEHRNHQFWEEPEPGKWVFKGWSALEPATPDTTPPQGLFEATDTLGRGGADRYITVGKGYP